MQDLWDRAINGKPAADQLTPEQMAQLGMPSVNKTPTPIGQINAGMAAPKLSKWDRVKAAIGDAGTKAVDTFMPTPKGLDGLLSPEDFAAARKQGLLNLGLSLLGDSGYRDANDQVSLGQALAHGVKSAQGAYGEKIGSTLQENQFGQAAQQQKARLESRAAIAKHFVAPPNESFEDAQQRLVKMYTAYVNAGDTEMAGKLSEVVKGIHEAKPHAPQVVGDGGSLVDANGKVLFHQPKTANPNANAASDRSQARGDRIQQNLIVSDFEKATHDYGKIEEAYNAVQASVKNPNNVYGTMAALEGMARMLNPGVSVRAATLQMLKGYGSVGDKIARFYESGAKGTWPQGMRDQIYQIANSAMQGSSENFDARRAEAIDRGRLQGVDVEGLLHKRKSGGATPAEKKKGSNPLLGR